MAFSSRLREERIRRMLSQSHLAELLGTTSNTISSWERGRNIPTPFFREKLATLFGLTMFELELLHEEPVNTLSSPSRAVPTSAIRDPLLPVLSEACSLVGRDALLERLVERFARAEGGDVFALHGLAGSGKTALVHALLQHPAVAQLFPNGVLWASLGPQPYDGDHIGRWARLLGVALPKGGLKREEALMRLRCAIDKRRLLIILDDVWHVEDAYLLQAAGSACVSIITTRSPLLAHQLTGLENIENLSELSKDESMQLLAGSVPHVVERYPDILRELIQFVGGLPLSLVLIGKYLQMESHSGQPKRIQHALASLQQTQKRMELALPTSVHNYPTQETSEALISLNTVIAVTDKHLSSAAQAGLRALAVFPPKPVSFPEEAALTLLSEGESILDELCDMGMLESAGEGRYQMHQSIADYARLHQQDTTQYTLGLVNYTLSYIHRYAANIHALEQEAPILFASLEAAYGSHHYSALIEGCQALQPFLVTRGLFALAQKYFAWSLEAAELLEDQKSQLFFLLHSAKVLEKLGIYDVAEQHVRRGLLLAQQRQESSQTEFFRLLGLIQLHHGKRDEAEALYHEGLVLAEQWNDREEMLVLLIQIATLLIQKNLIEAYKYVERGFSLLPSISDPLKKCDFLRLAGTCCRIRGDYKRAEAYLVQALYLAEQEGNVDLGSSVLRHLGLLVRRRGDYAQAEDYYQRSLTLSKQIGYREQIALRLVTLADVYISQGKDMEAEQALQEALEHARALQHNVLVPLCLLNLGELAYHRQMYMDSEQLYQEVLLAQQEGADNKEFLFYIYQGLTRNALQMQKIDKAKGYLQQLLALAQREGTSSEYMCLTFETQGEYALFMQDYSLADKAFSEMLKYVPEGEKDLETRAYYGLARVAAFEQRWTEAHTYGKRVIQQWRNMRHRRANEATTWMKQLVKTMPKGADF